MVKDTFYRDSLILTITNSATGILKFALSIILSRHLGAEGMGLFGLIMPIYDVFCCLVCGGMIAAISKESAVYFEKNDFGNLNKLMKVTLAFDLMWGSLVAILVFFSSSFITNSIIRDTRAFYSIIAICPAIIFVGLSSIIKGYFYGISNVKIPAIIDIVEKCARIAVVLAIIEIFALRDIQNTVTAVYIAFTFGEFMSLLLLYLFYKYVKNKYQIILHKNKIEGRAQLLFDVLVVSFPLCINGFLSTALGTVSTLITPRRIIAAGFDYTTALSMIGKFMGMASNIIYFPLVIIMSMSTALIPDLSQSLSKKDIYSVEKRISDVIRISFLLGISTVAICISLPKELGMLFYSRNDLGNYIAFSAISAPFTYVAATSFSVLNGIGKQGVLLKNSIIVSVEQLILIYIFTGIKSINIYGYGVSLIATGLTTLILNIYEIKKKYYLSFSKYRAFIALLLGTFLFFIMTTLNKIIPNYHMIFKNIFLVFGGFGIYFLVYMLLTKNISEDY